MNLTDVENLAELAKLELSEDEKLVLLHDMDSILAYVKQVEDMKVEDIEPEYKVYNVWREDQAEPREFSTEKITSQFPASHDGFLKVKKIL